MNNKMMRETMPFLFPKRDTRTQQGLPQKIAQQWSDMTYFFFLNNGLTSLGEIRMFLEAQTMSRLDDIAFAFDIISEDLVSQKERQEGVKLQEKHRGYIVEEILVSVTR
jgi:hypothetical protein